MKYCFVLLLMVLVTFTSMAQKKKKDDKKDKKAPPPVEYISAGDPTPKADTATKFTGVIKYRITTDDPAERDSMFIVFGEDKIGITMFLPGARADQVIESNMIARFYDSSLLTLDPRNRSYRSEKLSARNAGTSFSLANFKKTKAILSVTCHEYSGEMALDDGEIFEAACLVSRQHSFLAAADFNFFNIQPVVHGYNIVLGWRTKTADNENTYIIAYKIERGNTESYFDLTGYTGQ